MATEPIERGCVVWLPCPTCRVWSRAQIEAIPAASLEWLDEHGYWLDDGSLLLPCGEAFLMNHSCDAAVLDFGLDFGVAVRRIEPGEEVTCDYRTFVADPKWTFRCHCGTPQCVGDVSLERTVALALQADWRTRLVPALEAICGVRQPLHEIVAGTSATYRALMAGEAAESATSIVRARQ